MTKCQVKTFMLGLSVWAGIGGLAYGAFFARHALMFAVAVLAAFAGTVGMCLYVGTIVVAIFSGIYNTGEWACRLMSGE